MIRLKPDLAEAYYNRGVTYEAKVQVDHAIADFAKAIALNPNYAQAYYNRGLAYCVKGDFDHAVADFTKVIEFKPNAGVYYYRGIVWLHLREWEKAKFDLTTAKEKGIDIIAVFRNSWGSVTDFERRNGVKLPADLAAMLTPQQ